MRDFVIKMTTPNHKKGTREHRSREMERTLETANLKTWLKPGTTVYAVLRGHSRSGLSRTLEFYVVFNREICRITWSVAKILDLTYDERLEALRVKGCGIDMGREIVERLSTALFDGTQILRYRRL